MGGIWECDLVGDRVAYHNTQTSPCEVKPILFSFHGGCPCFLRPPPPSRQQSGLDYKSVAFNSNFCSYYNDLPWTMFRPVDLIESELV